MEYIVLAAALTAALTAAALAGVRLTRARSGHETLAASGALACVRRPLARRRPLDGQPARRIVRFCCARTPERTLLVVRLRTGRLYCLHLERSGRQEGARWAVCRAEGEECGALSEGALQLARRRGV